MNVRWRGDTSLLHITLYFPNLANADREELLPPQGFRPEAKSRGGTLVARAYIKESTYSTNMQSVYRKNLDLLEQGPRGIGR